MPTTAVSPQQDLLLRLLHQGRVYEFLPRAEAYLGPCCDDDHVRVLAVREYLKLGLVGPARTLLESDTIADHSELGAVRRNLRTVAAGAVPWSTQSKLFDDNLAALKARSGDAADSVLADQLRAVWAQRSRDFELYRDAGGVTHVRMRVGDGWRWIPFFGDHRALAAAQPLPEGIGGNFPGPFLFEGLDLGFFFDRVYQSTLRTFLDFSCALYVVEPDPVLVALVLHLHDWRTLLRDERVMWFVGPDAMRRLAQAWQNDVNLPPPTQAYMMNAFRPGCTPLAVAAIQAEITRRDDELERSQCEMSRLYAPRDRKFWAARFDEALSGRGAPLSIVAAVSVHTTFLQYSMEDTRRAVEALGHRMIVLKERRPFEVVHPLTYHQTIRAHDADLFLSIDHLRPEFGALLPDNLPLLTWDQDGLPQVVTKANIAGVAVHDFIVGSTKLRFAAEGCRHEQYLQSPIPTCPQRYAGSELTPEERARFACDVSYVSHASQTPHAFHAEEAGRGEYAHVRPLLDALYALLPDYLATYRVVRGALSAAIIADAERHTGIHLSDPALRSRIEGWYLWRLGDRMFRHEALEWVADWARASGRSLRIYGNGWDKHPTLAQFAAGPVANGRDLLCLYRASCVNLQLMPAGFIHQRALDGLAAGGFFLTRLAPQDLRGFAYKRLAARLHELQLTSTLAIMKSSDPELRRLLRLCIGPDVERINPDTANLHLIPLSAEWSYCDELFPDFEEITFDSAEEFNTAADRYITDEPARQAKANAMRDVVIKHFSYIPTVERFLSGMRDYLAASI